MSFNSFSRTRRVVKVSRIDCTRLFILNETFDCTRNFYARIVRKITNPRTAEKINGIWRPLFRFCLPTSRANFYNFYNRGYVCSNIFLQYVLISSTRKCSTENSHKSYKCAKELLFEYEKEIRTSALIKHEFVTFLVDKKLIYYPHGEQILFFGCRMITAGGRVI